MTRAGTFSVAILWLLFALPPAIAQSLAKLYHLAP